MACMGNSLDPADREFLSQLFNTHIDPKIMKILVVDGELPPEEIQTEQDQTVDTEEINSEDTEGKMPY